MIGSLTGLLRLKQPPHLLIDVQGVGYEVEAPMSTIFQLPAIGASLTLLTHLVVREDAQLLFGFASVAERSLFRELIRISGVGPKVALAILSGISVGDFWEVIRLGEINRLVKVPGIGKKTAERLVIELRDRAGGVAAAATAAGPSTLLDTPLAEAKAALEALGYKPAEAQKLLDAVDKPGASTDELIREALRRAVR